jgi:hypothetical protein
MERPESSSLFHLDGLGGGVKTHHACFTPPSMVILLDSAHFSAHPNKFVHDGDA